MRSSWFSCLAPSLPRSLLPSPCVPGTQDLCFEHRPSHGQRSGLVEHDSVEMREPLQRFSAFEEHAKLRAAAHRHGERGRNGQPHGAGAGDHQHGDSVGQRQLQRMRRR